jgi:hypothetical protein
MDSFLNFILFSDKFDANGIGNYGMFGPFYKYIFSKGKYSYTLNSEYREGYKNLILIEPMGTVHGITNIPKHDIKKIKDLIQTGCVKLLIVSLADPSGNHAFTKCIQFLKKNGIAVGDNICNSTDVIFIDSNTRYENIYTLDYFMEESFQYKYTYYGNSNSLGYTSFEIKESELNNFRNKKFLSFNRNTDKLNRLALLKEYITGNYSDSYFSFLMKITSYNDAPMSFDIDYYNTFIPIELDTHSVINKHNFSSSDTFRKDLFIDSCINLVTETSFVDNELFLSEKILKPLLSYQPFIVFGPYGYLKKLKTYGFKTFSEFWDEGYDDIINARERIEVLISLVRNLNKLSIEEMNELYQKTKNICIYNRALFYKLKMDTSEEILNNIENEW